MLTRIPIIDIATNSALSDMTATDSQLYIPVGIQWDNINHSCAYDAFFTVIINGQISFPGMWATASDHNRIFAYALSSCINPPSTFESLLSSYESSRDNVRDIIHTFDHTNFPRFGATLTDIGDLISTLTMLNTPFTTSAISCESCGYQSPLTKSINTLLLYITSSIYNEVCTRLDIATVMHTIFNPPRRCPCPHCLLTSSAVHIHNLDIIPTFICLRVPLEISDDISID